MKKKNILIFIVLIIIVVVGIGGNIYMDKQKRKEEILQAEKELSSYIVKNFKGVKKISFDEVVYLKETGSWNFSVIINNDKNNRISFTSFHLNKIKTNFTITYDPEKFKLMEQKDSTKGLEQVTIDYGGY